MIVGFCGATTSGQARGRFPLTRFLAALEIDLSPPGRGEMWHGRAPRSPLPAGETPAPKAPGEGGPTSRFGCMFTPPCAATPAPPRPARRDATGTEPDRSANRDCAPGETRRRAAAWLARPWPWPR